MKNVVILCDSFVDLAPGQLEEFGIIIIPIVVNIGGEEFRDTVDIDPAQMFRKIRETGAMPKTAASSAAAYADIWKPYLDAGNEIVHIVISSGFSSCYQNARMAASEIEGVYPVDSQNLSTGAGLLAIEASLMRKAGRSAREIAEALDEKKKRLDVSFVLETMDYLAKGGRCPAIAAFAAGIIKLRLMIEVKNGKMAVAGKYRGKMDAVLCQYARDRLKNAKNVDTDKIFVTFTEGTPPETVEKVKSAVLETVPFSRVFVSEAGCTVSAHCGPQTLGILFFHQ